MSSAIVPSGRSSGHYTSLTAELKVAGAERAVKELDEFTRFSEKAEKATEKLQSRLASFARFAGIFSSVVGAIATGTLGKFTASAVRTSMEFEKLDVQMRAMVGSARAADQATRWVKKFTMDTPYQLQQTTQAFVKLKAFGFDPMSGTMQAVADQAAKLGASSDVMGTIILSLGKAWSRGKMEGEDFNMMLEKGVPVTRLLSETLSITEQEVLKLRESGLLGREAIQALIDAMGEASKGASEAFMKTLPGALSNLSDAWQAAQDQFARGGGVTQALIDITNAVNTEITAILQGGQWKSAGQAIAAALKPVAKMVPEIALYLRAVVVTMWELKGAAWEAAKFLAGMWVVAKIAKYLDYLNRAYILMRALMALAYGRQMSMAAGGFGQLAMSLQQLELGLNRVYPKIAKLIPEFKGVAEAASKAALRMYVFQASLMAAYLAATVLANVLDRLNNEHLNKNNFEGGASPAVRAQQMFSSSLSPEEYQDFKDLARDGKDLTRVFWEMDTILARSKATGKNATEFLSLFSRQGDATFIRFLGKWEETLKQAKIIAAKTDLADPLLAELEEIEKTWAGKAKAEGERLLALLAKAGEEEALKKEADAAFRFSQELVQVGNLLDDIILKKEKLIGQQLVWGIEHEEQARNAGLYEDTGYQWDPESPEPFIRGALESDAERYNRELEEKLAAAADFEARLQVLQDDTAEKLAKAREKYWKDQEDDMKMFGRTFSDLMNNVMVGDLENFSQIWTKIWQQMASTVVDMLGSALMNTLSGRAGKDENGNPLKDADGNVIASFWDALSGRGGSGKFEDGTSGKYTTGETAAAVVAGAGMIINANQQGGWGGAIQGAMGGASMGMPWAVATGGVSMIIGAIVGGLAGYFGGSEAPTPTTTFGYSPNTGAYMDAQDQEETAQKIQVFTQAITVTYRKIEKDWRDTLRLFDDPSLFQGIGDAVGMMRKEWDMSMQDLTTWLTQSKLPTEFQHRYQNMVKKGLRNLGLTVDSANEVFKIIRELPGDQRLDALRSVINALVVVRDLLEVDFAALEFQMDRSFVDEFVESMEDVSVSMAMLTTGWEDMDLVERAGDLEQIGQLFQGVLDATKNALNQIDQIIKQLETSFADLRESFETKGMENEDLYSYYESQYNKYAALLANTDDPVLIAEYAQRMTRYMALAADMIDPEQWKGEYPGGEGETYQEWYLKELARLEELALAAENAQRERIQEQYDSLYAQLEFIRSQYEVFGGAIEETTIAIVDMGGAARAVADILHRLPDGTDEGDNKSLVTTSAASTSSSTTKSSAIDPLSQIIINPPQVIVNISGSLGGLRPMVQSLIREATTVRRASRSIS